MLESHYIETFNCFYSFVSSTCPSDFVRASLVAESIDELKTCLLHENEGPRLWLCALRRSGMVVCVGVRWVR